MASELFTSKFILQLGAIFLMLIQNIISQDPRIITCQPQGNIKISTDYRMYNIYGIDISVNLTDTLHDPTPNNDLAQEISTNGITFSAYIRPEDEVVDDKINLEYLTILSTNVYFSTEQENDVLKKYCSVGFIEDSYARKYYDEKIEATILEIIEACVLSHFCYQLEGSQKWVKYNNVQAQINNIADVVANTIVEMFITPKLIIPEISGSYLALTFTAKNITFINQPDVERAADVDISHEELKFIFGIDITIRRLNLHSEDFSYAVLSGPVSLYFNRVSFGVKLSIDYNKTPCKASLVEFDIYDFGKITIDRPNGFWFNRFNNESSSTVNGVILGAARNITVKMLEENLAKFDCDNFSFDKDQWESIIETSEMEKNKERNSERDD